MMPGMCMWWPFSVASIPSGWHECDGTMGTPDYRGRFLMGATIAWPPGFSAGGTTHSHGITGDGHAHNLLGGNVIIDSSPAGDFAYGTNISAITGDTDVQGHYPPFTTGCWIMKL